MKKLTRCHCIHPRICRWHPPTPTPTLIILRACRGSKKKTEGFHFQNCKFPSLTSRRHCCYHLRHLHRLLLLDRSFPPPARWSPAPKQRNQLIASGDRSRRSIPRSSVMLSFLFIFFFSCFVCVYRSVPQQLRAADRTKA